MFNWRAFLEDWSTRAISALKAEGAYTDLARRALARGRLMFEPATAEDVRRTEQRLGTVLPASYREFLLVSNGAFVVSDAMCTRLLSIDEIGWFRDLHPHECAIWSVDDGGDSMTDVEYFTYGKSQEPALMRRQYVRECLAISEKLEYGQYLLNPQIRTDTGDWEAWDLSPKLPGALRYQTFLELMQTCAQLEVRGTGKL